MDGKIIISQERALNLALLLLDLKAEIIDDPKVAIASIDEILKTLPEPGK